MGFSQRFFRLFLGLTCSALWSLHALAQGTAQDQKELLPHYLCAEKRSLRDILLKRWAPYEFPVKVYLPYPPAEFNLPDPQSHYAAVQEAFWRWKQAWPDFSYVFVPEPGRDGIQVVWYDHVYRDGQGRWGEAYYPEFFWFPDAKAPGRQVLHWSKINLAVRAHPGSAFVRTETPILSFLEMRDLAVHEIGHALGLNHSDDANDVMGSHHPFQITELDMRKISPRDVETLRYLYSLPYSLKTHPCPGR